MLKDLLRGLLASVAVKLFDLYRRLSLQLLKIEATKCYLRGVQMVRLSVLGLLGLGLVIGLIFVGVLLVHAALFILLPWSLTAKAVLGLCLGVVYVVMGIGVLRVALSERLWMEKSGATKMLKEATGQSEKD